MVVRKRPRLHRISVRVTYESGTCLSLGEQNLFQVDGRREEDFKPCVLKDTVSETLKGVNPQTLALDLVRRELGVTLSHRDLSGLIEVATGLPGETQFEFRLPGILFKKQYVCDFHNSEIRIYRWFFAETHPFV